MGEITSMCARGLNAGAEVVGECAVMAAKLALPVSVGAVTGTLLGVGPVIGALQGAFSGVFHSVCLVPLGEFLDENTGWGEGEIHPGTRFLLGVASLVAEVALPVLVVGTLTGIALATAPAGAPLYAGSALAFGALVGYTVTRGVVVQGAISLADRVVSLARPIFYTVAEELILPFVIVGSLGMG